jgi:hypothetical protein
MQSISNFFGVTPPSYYQYSSITLGSQEPGDGGRVEGEEDHQLRCVTIQEPWRNPSMHTTHHPIRQHFELAYYDYKKTRVCFFVNKGIEVKRW